MIPLRDDNPTHSTPWVTYLLFGANLAVFAFQLQVRMAGGDQAYVAMVTRLGLVPAALTSPALWTQMPIPAPLTLLTSMFVHGDLFHLGGNMLYLWVFADNIEDTLGSVRFLGFYLMCGLSAAGAQVVFMPGSTVPMVGASGAIAGVLGAYMLLYPTARVLTLVFLVIFIRIMYLPSVLLLGIWFLIQLWSASSSGTAGVAWYAHIGGFVAGLSLAAAWAQKSRRRLPRPETYRNRP